MIQILKNNMFSWLAIVISLAFAFSFMNDLPEQIPTHFNTLGQADQYSPKLFALLYLPCIAAGTVIFVSGLLRLSPNGYKAEQSIRTVALLNFGITLFVMLIYIASLREALEPGKWISRAVPIGLSMLTIFMGNYFGKIERNFVVGIRLPWTLASDDNWKQTHRFAARACMISGLVSLVWVCIHPNLMTPLVGITAPMILTIVFSYTYFKNMQKQL